MSDTRHPTPTLMIAGPTASGKSGAALVLAERLGGEIVSVDSMQVYRGMDIGTAKPTLAERRTVPHHLIDVAGCGESFDAARFVVEARRAVLEICGRRHLPILCGGTGLYFKAFLDGLGEAPAADGALRAELERVPIGDLLRELQEMDPETFRRIDRKNPRRVIRAIEVLRLTGQPHSSRRAAWGRNAAADPAVHPQPVFVLRRVAADLRARIDARVERMFEAGLVDETRRLLKEGLAENRTAMQAIGYRQVVEHLRGVRSLPETVELVKIRTRQFAKRQMTWFRGQLPAIWIDVAPSDSAAAIADRLQIEFERRHAGSKHQYE